jgi:hypothetical protein
MFKKALIDAFRWSIKWYVGSFSTAVATFFFFEKYLEFERIRSLRYGIATIVASFMVKALYQYVKQIDELEQKILDKDETITILNTKKEKNKQLSAPNYYGEAIIILKDSFSKFHSLRKKSTTIDAAIDKKEMVSTLSVLCNNVKDLFEKRFKHNYSVCIKILGPNVDLQDITAYAQIATLCRDEKSYKSRSQPGGVQHNIFENTCFNEIFHNIDDHNKSHYLNNDLTEDKYYKNSSSKIYGEIPDDCSTVEERRKNWKLPYRSELVVPIAPIDLDNSERRKQFLGYLCVDCNEVDAFHLKYDVAMLKGVADGIFDIIKYTYNKN